MHIQSRILTTQKVYETKAGDAREKKVREEQTEDVECRHRQRQSARVRHNIAVAKAKRRKSVYKLPSISRHRVIFAHAERKFRRIVALMVLFSRNTSFFGTLVMPRLD